MILEFQVIQLQLTRNKQVLKEEIIFLISFIFLIERIHLYYQTALIHERLKNQMAHTWTFKKSHSLDNF